MNTPAANLTEAMHPPAPQRPSRWGKGFLALSASLLLPGLGHLWAGRRRRALFWFVLSALLNAISFVVLVNARWIAMLLPVLSLGILLSLCLMVDAFLCGRRSPKPLLGHPVLRYATGVALFVISSYVNWPMRVAYYVRDHCVEAFVIRTASMSPTLEPGDQFLVHKKEPWERWSLVLADDPREPGVPYPRRVVGLPGETIEIVGNRLEINGQPVDPPAGIGPYVSLRYSGDRRAALRRHPGAGCEGNPIRLGPDECFILGDNSPRCLDARLWEVPFPGHQLGALPVSHVKGRITAIYWPPNRWRVLR